MNSLNSNPHVELDIQGPPDVVTAAGTPVKEAQRRHLLLKIVTRIESRLPGRIRGLSVSVAENAIILCGQCSTYYTKQVAQHTAMGVLNYERVINNILVQSPK